MELVPLAIVLAACLNLALGAWWSRRLERRDLDARQAHRDLLREIDRQP